MIDIQMGELDNTDSTLLDLLEKLNSPNRPKYDKEPPTIRICSHVEKLKHAQNNVTSAVSLYNKKF